MNIGPIDRLSSAGSETGAIVMVLAAGVMAACSFESIPAPEFVCTVDCDAVGDGVAGGDARGSDALSGDPVTPGDTFSCVPESLSLFCDRWSAECDVVSENDNCGQPRSVNCGGCAAPLSCGGGGTPNVCGRPVWYGVSGSEFAPYDQYALRTTHARGGISNQISISKSSSLALDANGNIVVAWVNEVASGTRIYVRRWDGTSWEEQGAGSASGDGISSSQGLASAPSVVVDSGGHAIVAWQDNASATPQIYVKRFDGVTWKEIGPNSATSFGVSKTSGHSSTPSLALDGNDNPIVAWTDLTDPPVDIFVKRFDGTNWNPVGSSIAPNGISGGVDIVSWPSLAVDGNNRPVVAWQATADGVSQIVMRRFGANNWDEVSSGSATTTSGGGGISNTDSESTKPSLAINGAGNLIVGWSDDLNGPFEIYVRELQGSNWSYLGGAPANGFGISGTGEASRDVSLALDASGRPVVAWVEETAEGDDDIFIRQWNGTIWTEPFSGSATGEGISANAGDSMAPSIGVNDSGKVAVAWHDDSQQDFNYDIFAKLWDGSVAQNMANAQGNGISNASDVSLSPRVVIATDGAPVVVWRQFFNGSNWQIYAAVPGGAAWDGALLGSANATGINGMYAAAGEPVTALSSSNELTIIWPDPDIDGEIYVAARGASAWEDVGSGSRVNGGISATGGATRPDMVLDTFGRPYVVWEDDSSSKPKIFIRHYDGSSWQPVGVDSANADGISNTDSVAIYPSIALGLNNHPIVAWQDSSAEPFQIYVRRYTGSAWVSVGTSSDALGGISNSTGASIEPVVVVDIDGPVVAWIESDPTPRIYVRRFNGSSWDEMAVGSASNGGVSNATGIVGGLSLAASHTGKIGLAWHDASYGNYEIYFRQWDGTDWSEIGSSATGGGVSNSGESSLWPNVDIAVGLVCISWTERGALATTEILLRCANAL